MNALRVGITRTISIPPGGSLSIFDELPDEESTKHLRRPPIVFDPMRDSFNPFEKLDYRKACDIEDAFDALFDRGDTTLTKDTGLDFIADCLEAKPKALRDLVPAPGKNASPGHIWAHSKVKKILRSPVLRRVLCDRTDFTFNPRSTIFARINRAELGEFDALVLGLLLMAHYKGQIVVPDMGFYGRDAHVSLIRQGRLIAGVDFLGELPPKLRRAVLTIKDKDASGANYEDAVTLAQYERLVPDTNKFNETVQAAMM